MSYRNIYTVFFVSCIMFCIIKVHNRLYGHLVCRNLKKMFKILKKCAAKDHLLLCNERAFMTCAKSTRTMSIGMSRHYSPR